MIFQEELKTVESEQLKSLKRRNVILTASDLHILYTESDVDFFQSYTIEIYKDYARNYFINHKKISIKMTNLKFKAMGRHYQLMDAVTMIFYVG